MNHISRIDCSDALDFDPRGVAAGFHLLLVDPPYSAHVHENAMSCSASGGESNGVRKRDFAFASLSRRLRQWIALASSNVAAWSLIYSDIESASKWRWSVEAAGAEYVRALPWVRWSQPQLSGDRPPSGCEMVTIAHRADYVGRKKPKPLAKQWSGSGGLTHLGHKSLRGAEKHATEKPLDQALDLISWFSLPDQWVLDPCAGRGTTCIAALLLDRNSIGFENDPDEAALANGRIARARAGQFIERDFERIARWFISTLDEASDVPLDEKHPGAYNRAQRRLADCAIMQANLLAIDARTI